MRDPPGRIDEQTHPPQPAGPANDVPTGVSRTAVHHKHLESIRRVVLAKHGLEAGPHIARFITDRDDHGDEGQHRPRQASLHAELCSLPEHPLSRGVRRVLAGFPGSGGRTTLAARAHTLGWDSWHIDPVEICPRIRQPGRQCMYASRSPTLAPARWSRSRRPRLRGRRKWILARG